MLRLEPVAAVATEPVSLAQAKLWLRVDHAHEDALVSALVSAARDLCERHTGLALAPQSWRMAVDGRHLDVVAGGLPVEMMRPPFGSLLEAEALLADGTTAAVPLDTLVVAGVDPAFVRLRAGKSFPAGMIELRLTYTAAQAAPCPPAALQAIRLLVAQWYETREAAVPTSYEVREVPNAVRALLSTLCVARL